MKQRLAPGNPIHHRQNLRFATSRGVRRLFRKWSFLDLRPTSNFAGLGIDAMGSRLIGIHVRIPRQSPQVECHFTQAEEAIRTVATTIQPRLPALHMNTLPFVVLNFNRIIANIEQFLVLLAWNFPDPLEVHRFFYRLIPVPTLHVYTTISALVVVSGTYSRSSVKSSALNSCEVGLYTKFGPSSTWLPHFKPPISFTIGSWTS